MAKRESAVTKLLDKSLIYNAEQRLAGGPEKPKPPKLASDKAYIYRDGKFNIPLGDIDPAYAHSRSVARVPPSEITADQAYEILKRHPREIKKAPWAARHPGLTALIGTGIGAAGGAGIGALFRPRGASAAIGALAGTIPGVLGGSIHSGSKALRHVEDLRRKKKLKTASAATEMAKGMAPWILIPAGVGGAIGGVVEPKRKKKGRTGERLRNIGVGALLGGLLGVAPGFHHVADQRAQKLYQAARKIRGSGGTPPSYRYSRPQPHTPRPTGKSPSKGAWGNYAKQPPPKPPAGGFGSSARVKPGPSAGAYQAKVKDVADWARELRKHPQALKAEKYGLPVDPFDIKTAPMSKLKTKYRAAMRKTHPDINPSGAADASALNQWKAMAEKLRNEKIASLFEDGFFAEIQSILSL